MGEYIGTADSDDGESTLAFERAKQTPGERSRCCEQQGGYACSESPWQNGRAGDWEAVKDPGL